MRYYVLVFILFWPILLNVADDAGAVETAEVIDPTGPPKSTDLPNPVDTQPSPVDIQPSPIDIQPSPIDIQPSPDVTEDATITKVEPAPVNPKPTVPLTEDCKARIKTAKLFEVCFYVVAGVGGLLTFLFILAFILVRVAACLMRSQGMDEPKKPWETVVSEEQANATNATNTENVSGYGTVSQAQ